jgi:hypothetical protein
MYFSNLLGRRAAQPQALAAPGTSFAISPLRAHYGRNAATIAIHMTVSVQTPASPKPMLEARLK